MVTIKLINPEISLRKEQIRAKQQVVVMLARELLDDTLPIWRKNIKEDMIKLLEEELEILKVEIIDLEWKLEWKEMKNKK